MKRLALHAALMALLCAAAWSFAACSRGEHCDEDVPHGTYMQVTIRTNGNAPWATRGPQGGEDGDGREWGFDNENEVKNVTLLLFRGAQGINGGAGTVVEFALYAPDMYKEADGSYRSALLHYDTPLPVDDYHVLALVNVGDRTDLQGKTLGQVRDMVERQPFEMDYAADGTPRVEKARNFVMTSARDVVFRMTYNAGIETPIRFGISVERLAARVDFSPGPIAGDNAGGASSGESLCEWVEKGTTVDTESGSVALPDGGYRYAVLDGATGQPSDDRFIMTGVTSFNCLNAGTYWFKRVMNDLGNYSGIVYLGDETTDTYGNATNCVLDPLIFLKQTTPSGRLPYRYPMGEDGVQLSGNSPWPVKSVSQLRDDSDDRSRCYRKDGLRYYVLDYLQENTLLPEMEKDRLASGLLISGYYGKADGDGRLTYRPHDYYYYIRHADPLNAVDESLPMKYGIVRNNIYRIHIESVNSLGHISIVVNDWRRIDVPEIQV